MVHRAPPPAALIVAHPGHELMVYGWMENARPVYCCLTDGSGGRAQSRLASTARLLEHVGARQGPVYGRFPDQEVYRDLLAGRVEVFADLVEELAQMLIDEGIGAVAGDAAEGINPSHDLCRFLIDGAVALVERRTGRALLNYDFVLDSRPDAAPEAVGRDALWLELDAAAVERKIVAARGYPELRGEVEGALARFGRAAYARECLRPSTTATMLEQFAREAPAYERWGALRVSEGRYRDVLRYREHVLPALSAIERRARAGSR